MVESPTNQSAKLTDKALEAAAKAKVKWVPGCFYLFTMGLSLLFISPGLPISESYKQWLTIVAIAGVTTPFVLAIIGISRDIFVRNT